jgi:hypothetical protein
LFWRPNSTARGDVRAHGLSGVREEGPQGRGAAGGGERRGDRHGAAEGDGERGRGAEEGAQGGAPDGAARRAVACPLHRGRGRRRRDASPGAAAADVPARRRGGAGRRGGAVVPLQLLQARVRRLEHVLRQLGRRHRHQDHRLLQRRERARLLPHVTCA